MTKMCPKCNGTKGLYKPIRKGSLTVPVWVPCSFCRGTGKKATL